MINIAFFVTSQGESISDPVSTTLGFPINLCEVGCAVAAWQLLFGASYIESRKQRTKSQNFK